MNLFSKEYFFLTISRLLHTTVDLLVWISFVHALDTFFIYLSLIDVGSSWEVKFGIAALILHAYRTKH